MSLADFHQPRLLDTFTGRLRLEGTLTTRTGLHIGTGGSHDPLATDSPVVRDASGQPYIPGASVKGVIRSAAEALLRGAAVPLSDAARLWSCEIFGDDNAKCVSHKRLKEYREAYEKQQKDRKEKGKEDKEKKDSRDLARAVWAKSCTACRLFGSLAMASRVRFPDLPLAAPSTRFEIRNGVGIDRDKELAAKGVLYDFEAVPPGTAFRCTLIFDNYHDAEVGLVLYLFDQLSQGQLALGGKGSRGLGLVEVRWDDVIETTLGKGDNPFARLLSERRLLDAEAAEEEEEVPAEPERPLPGQGNPEDWKTLGEILLALPEIDKSALGQAAGQAGLPKKELNDRLGLGLSPKKLGRTWDKVLETFAQHGWITRVGDGYVLAGQEPEPAESETAAEDRRDPQMQKLYDRFIGAMYELWEEGTKCSASS